jgi:ABC-type multidrug transport system ATPase subunit
MLELRNICYSVPEGGGELGILNNISLTVPDHKLLVFTGPNGGGKTTLAKVIMGLVRPTSGTILWNGEDITDLWASPSGPEAASATVFSSRPASRASRVRKDLLTVASGSKPVSKDQCCKFLTEVGLCANDYVDREVNASLSGGEVKRIEIATILARGTQADDLRRARGRHRPVELHPPDRDLRADVRRADAPPWSSSPTRSASSQLADEIVWYPAAARSSTGARAPRSCPRALSDEGAEALQDPDGQAGRRRGGKVI